jgi:hypothetical protein
MDTNVINQELQESSKSMMRFEFISIFAVKGLTHPEGSADREILAEQSNGMRAILTRDASSYSFERDRGLAVVGAMMRGFFGLQPNTEDFRSRVQNEIDELWATRVKSFGKTPYLVVLAKGDYDSFDPSHEKEFDDFDFCFDAADKGAIRRQIQPRVTALVNAITSGLDSVVGVSKVADGVVFFRDNGKPVYTYTLTALPVSVYKSSPLSDEQVVAVQQLFRLYSKDSALPRVQQLLQSSFETADDILRSFLAAWSAFEIFVNKVFADYQKSFFEGLVEDGRLGAKKKYLERIQDVMKDKYRVNDKFAAIAFQLSAETADEDLQSVSGAKKVRDRLAHGETVDDSEFPVKTIREIASKYVRLHVTRKGNTQVTGN